MDIKLKNKSNEELIQIIEQMIEINPNNQELLIRILNNSKPNYQYAYKTIKRNMSGHQGSYRIAYLAYTKYIETNPDFLDTLKLTQEILPYFLEELDSYHTFPDDLIEMVVHIYGMACKNAIKANQLDYVIKLYEMMNDYDFSDDIIDELLEAFYSNVPSEISEEIDSI